MTKQIRTFEEQVCYAVGFTIKGLKSLGVKDNDDLEVDGDDDNGYYIYRHVKREETDTEYKMRLHMEARQKELRKREYETLKKEFGEK